eukprot:scaffold18.g2022.t1
MICITSYAAATYGCASGATLNPPMNRSFTEAADEFFAGGGLAKKENIVIVDPDDNNYLDITKIRARWLPEDARMCMLHGWTRQEMVELYKKSKVLVDSYLTGRERPVFESSLFGVVPIFATHANGLQLHDYPTPRAWQWTPFDYDRLNTLLNRTLSNHGMAFHELKGMREYVRSMEDVFTLRVWRYFQEILSRSPQWVHFHYAHLLDSFEHAGAKYDATLSTLWSEYIRFGAMAGYLQRPQAQHYREFVLLLPPSKIPIHVDLAAALFGTALRTGAAVIAEASSHSACFCPALSEAMRGPLWARYARVANALRDGAIADFNRLKSEFSEEAARPGFAPAPHQRAAVLIEFGYCPNTRLADKWLEKIAAHDGPPVHAPSAPPLQSGTATHAPTTIGPRPTTARAAPPTPSRRTRPICDRLCAGGRRSDVVLNTHSDLFIGDAYHACVSWKREGVKFTREVGQPRLATAGENEAVVRGLSKYIKQKQLDPLGSYVPLLLEARDQLIRTGRVMLQDPDAARKLLRTGSFAGLRDNVRAVGQYAAKASGKEAGDTLVAAFFGALQEFDYQLLQATRSKESLGPEARKKLDASIVALDECAGLLATVPADEMASAQRIVDAIREPEEPPAAVAVLDVGASPVMAQQ